MLKSCVSSKFCFRNSIVYVNNYEEVCKTLKWTRDDMDFSKLLRLCTKKLILPMKESQSVTVFPNKSLLLFTSYINTYGEVFIRSVPRLDFMKTYFENIFVHNWYFEHLLTPFTNNIRIYGDTDAHGCYDGYICDFSGQPNPDTVNVHTAIRKVMNLPPYTNTMHAFQKEKKKTVLFVFRQGKTRRMIIQNLDKCERYFSCIFAHGMNNTFTRKVIPHIDIFVSVHGSDVVNAYAMNFNAQVLEIMPPRGRWQCDCHMHKKYFKHQHYTEVKALHAVRNRGSYQENITISFSDIYAAITSNKSLFIAESLRSTKDFMKYEKIDMGNL